MYSTLFQNGSKFELLVMNMKRPLARLELIYDHAEKSSTLKMYLLVYY